MFAPHIFLQHHVFALIKSPLRGNPEIAGWRENMILRKIFDSNTMIALPWIPAIVPQNPAGKLL